MPEVYVAIRQLLHSPDTTIDDFVEVVEADSMLAVRVMRMATSQYFGFPRSCDTLYQAIRLIGLMQLHDLLLGTLCMRTFAAVPEEVLNLKAFWRYNVQCGIAAKTIARLSKADNQQVYFSLGLLHEIGHASMFVKEPGQTEGRIDERPTQTIDIVPTILDVLDAESPWPLDGRSMLADPDAGPDVRTFTEWSLNTRDPDDGIYYNVDGAAAYAELLALDPVVPPGNPAMRLWQWGAFGSLVGTPVTDQTIGEVSNLTLSIDQPENRPPVSEALANVGADDRPPLYISGVLEDELSGQEQRLLIAAINGTIVGWNQTKVVNGDTRFWTLAWPEALVNGFNDLAVFEAIGMGDDLVLRPVVLSG